ncbi:MAG: hypothetical protein J6B91_02630 [Prevotella sp.]|nr:hypothetical protein [Prevotella sp.]
MLSRRNMLSRKLFANQLRINAMIQDGTRPRHAAYTARWRPAETDT